MKRTTFWKYSVIVGIVLTFAMAWVNYWAMFALLCIAGACGIAWLVSDYSDYANEQQRMKEYHERLKQK